MGSVGGVVSGLPCVCVGDRVFVRGRVLSGESGWENRELGEEMMEEEEGEFWFPLLLTHNDVILSYETRPADQWADPRDGHKLDQSLRHSSERQNTEEKQGHLHWLFKLLTSAILYLQQNVFPIQTMTNCVQYRPNKWIVFVYMETEQHSWMALTNQAQRGLQCRCLPKERTAAHSGWQMGSCAPPCG